LTDQQTLDILDPLYEQLLLTPDADVATQPGMIDCSLSPGHVQRLTDWLVEACCMKARGTKTVHPSSIKATISTTATATTTISTPSPPPSTTTSKRKKVSPREIFTQTLQQVKELTGREYTVHAYRPAIDANADTPFIVTPAVDCTNLPTLSTYRHVPLGLVLASNGYAVGALLLEYQYIAGVTVMSSTPPIQVYWRHLVLSDVEIDSDANALVAIVLIALSMQHARYAARVRYGAYDYNVSTPPPYGDFFQECFRLVRLPLPVPPSMVETGNNTAPEKEAVREPTSPQGDCNALVQNDVKNSTESSQENVNVANAVEPKQVAKSPVLVNNRVRLLADLNKSSTKYALLTWKRLMSDKAVGNKKPQEKVEIKDSKSKASSTKYRSLIRLPNVDEATSLIERRLLRRKKTAAGVNGISVYSSAPSAQRNVSLQLQAIISDEDKTMQFTVGEDKAPVEIPSFIEDPVGFHIMKTFPLRDMPELDHDEETDLLLDLKAKQEQLMQLETALEPRLRSIMEKVVQERIDFEKGDHLAKIDEERRILEENRKLLERRLIEDEEKMKRLEQDMDAVCCICDDGEVTPDNQIIFCESCNVPVHQLCYGVEKIPSEDYYCLACQYFHLDNETKNTDSQGGFGALPVTCSLCPHQGGALIRSNVPLDPDDTQKLGTWVHVVCAKWQGLDFVNPKKPNLIEDLTELRDSFRRHKLFCSLCEGDRGCMNKCLHEGCNNWMHILCARSSGLCKVTHGEDCHGDIPDNPWSLICPDHSDISPEDVPENATPLSKLIEMADKFPPEPEPELLPIAHMPFNEANADERRRLTADPEYEKALIYELLYKRHVGIRCEVCENSTLLSKDIIRCTSCAISFCRECVVEGDNCEGNYKCPACRFLQSSTKEGEQNPPMCIACYQKGGPLRPAFATPVKKSTWSNRRKEYQRSIFARKFWVHTLCAL
jgi:hypothetical protein